MRSQDNDDTRTKSKQYRVTIGTEYNKNVQAGESPGPSNCEIEMKIEGSYTKADGPFPNNVLDDSGNAMPIGFASETWRLFNSRSTTRDEWGILQATK